MKCVLVGSAKISNYSVLLNRCKQTDLIVAADGGINHLEKIKVKPNLIVGDMDSTNIEIKHLTDVKVVGLSKEKDETDTFFAVNEAIKLGADEFIIFGGLNGRLDHTYANLCVAKYLSEKNIEHTLVADDFEAFVLGPGSKKIVKGKKGQTVSVFPFGCEKCKVKYEGLRYKMDDECLESNFPKGVSNKLENNFFSITTTLGYTLCIVYT